MPRKRRYAPIGVPQHIIQRGNNRNVCFASNDDMAAYAHFLKEAAQKYSVDIHAWVFMTNHVHLLATPNSDLGASKMMQHLGRRYVPYFNYTYRRSGTLWEGRFRSCLITDEKYLLACYRYIELNPVRADMVKHPSDYEWSSYMINAYAKKSDLCKPHPLYQALGNSQQERCVNYRALFNETLDERIIKDIRKATQQGFFLGNENLAVQVKELVRF